MSNTEFVAWKAYNILDPIGNDRLDVLFAQLTAMIHNVNCSKQHQLKKPSEFIPKWGITEERSEEDRHRNIRGFMEWAKARGRAEAKKGNKK